MIEKNKINGSIIQFASIYGKLGQDQSIYSNTSMKENVAYSFLKGGIVNLSRQMAAYYGKYNIRVNCISPGGIEDAQQDEFKNRYIVLEAVDFGSVDTLHFLQDAIADRDRKMITDARDAIAAFATRSY